MNKILISIFKNLKILFRNKISLMILIFGPLIILGILGFLFENQNTYNINVGFSIPDDSPLSYVYLEKLKKKKIRLIEFETRDKCIEGIKMGMNHLCLFFPENFNIENNITNLIEIKVDSSKQNVVDIAQNLILSTLEDQTDVFQTNNTQMLVNVVAKSEKVALNNQNYYASLQNKLEELRIKNTNIEKELVKLVYSLNFDDLNVADLSEKSLQINDSIQSFVGSSYDLVDNMNININNISEIVDNLNLTSITTQDDLEDFVDDVKEDLDRIEIKLSSLKTNYNLKILNSEIKEILGSIESMNTKVVKLIDGIKYIGVENIDVYNNVSDSIFENNNSNTELLNLISRVKIRDSGAITHPIELRVDSVVAQDNKSHLKTLIPRIFVSLILIVSIILSSNFVLSEKNNLGYFRNFLTKSGSFSFFFSNFITLFFIVLFQMFLVLCVYYGVFLKQYTSYMFNILLFLIPMIAVFVLIGMLIGYLSSTQVSNVILSFVVIFLLLAFSGIMLPLEILTAQITKLALMNPYLVSEGVLRKFLLFDATFIDFKFEFIVLGIYFGVLFVLGWVCESINKKRTIYQYYMFICLKMNKMFSRPKKNDNKKKKKDKKIE